MLELLQPKPFEKSPESLWDSIWKFLQEFDWIYQIGLIVIGALILRWILLYLVKKIVNRVVHGVKATHGVTDTKSLDDSPMAAVRVVQRTRTLGSVSGNTITWSIIILASILILDRLGFSITALIASAGVIGAALAFGAQNLIKDALNGLFMVFEDQLGVGDLVDLGPATGIVEAVGLRVTQIRDVNGTVWYVRNGEIMRVGNMSQDWARVILDLAIPYTSDLELVQTVMVETAAELSKDPDWSNRIVGKPEIWGLESISAEALVIRLAIKTRASAKFSVGRELRKRIKIAFDEKGLHLPITNRYIVENQHNETKNQTENPTASKLVDKEDTQRSQEAGESPAPTKPIKLEE